MKRTVLLQRAALSVVVFSAAGCRGPPEAPRTLDALCGYVFQHAIDDDPEVLRLGMENLRLWLDAHADASLDGYTIRKLDADSVAGLEGVSADLSGLVGAAVGLRSTHTVAENAIAVTWRDQEEIYPDAFESFDRTYLVGSPECLLERSCERARTYTSAVADYPLGLTVGSHYFADYRWVDTSDGAALISRTWLDGPADISLSWLEVPAQFYVSAFLPEPDGARRIMATWIDARISDAGVPEDFALGLVVDAMRDDAATSDAWLDGR